MSINLMSSLFFLSIKTSVLVILKKFCKLEMMQS
uniref:Uncharacterized protein n=1 Tax=Anguilla anguilla TaxID=7936 RepID=A0A0E9TW07_ANGAN